jgi:hypothetical protein
MHTGIWLENSKENNRLEDLGGEDRIILKSNLKKTMGGGGQNRSASERGKLLADVNKEMNIGTEKKQGAKILYYFVTHQFPDSYNVARG